MYNAPMQSDLLKAASNAADLNDICDYAYLEDGECVESAWVNYCMAREAAQKVAA